MSVATNSILAVKSPAFNNNDRIPAKYTCNGLNVNPELNLENIPPETKTLALIVDDSDAPGGSYAHWVVWNIPPGEIISENTTPGTEGENNNHDTRYFGPCPPPGRLHHYHFRVYALDTKL